MAKVFEPIYALKDGSIVSIDDVTEEERGLKCNCICAACGDRLVAKIKGEKRKPHFAHNSRKDCEYGYESSLHLAAKDILSKAKKMVVPPVYVQFQTYKKAELVTGAREIEIEKVELEKRVGRIIPDIVVYSGGEQFFVEIYVTHPIDAEKLEKIKKEDISTIEIDLSKLSQEISVEELSDYLLKDSFLKTWKYNRLSGQWYNRFLDIADKKPTTIRGMAIHVDYCPIKARVWNGKPYANFIDDCQGCEYWIADTEDGILCSGRQRISTVADFSIPESERIKPEDQIVEEPIDISDGKCPKCGGKLVKRKGMFGEFWGCSNYPNCYFTAPIVDIDSNVQKNARF